MRPLMASCCDGRGRRTVALRTGHPSCARGANRARSRSGQTATVTAEARDPDGNRLRYKWSAPAGIAEEGVEARDDVDRPDGRRTGLRDRPRRRPQGRHRLGRHHDPGDQGSGANSPAMPIRPSSSSRYPPADRGAERARRGHAGIGGGEAGGDRDARRRAAPRALPVPPRRPLEPACCAPSRRLAKPGRCRSRGRPFPIRLQKPSPRRSACSGDS